ALAAAVIPVPVLKPERRRRFFCSVTEDLNISRTISLGALLLHHPEKLPDYAEKLAEVGWNSLRLLIGVFPALV
ncbi:MAG: hypothetical protein RBS57_13005, partial [Desulforhabdus sp.]|nr:hypothetical protein [Desulforhabdus sp.]